MISEQAIGKKPSSDIGIIRPIISFVVSMPISEHWIVFCYTILLHIAPGSHVAASLAALAATVKPQAVFLSAPFQWLEKRLPGNACCHLSNS